MFNSKRIEDLEYRVEFLEAEAEYASEELEFQFELIERMLARINTLEAMERISFKSFPAGSKNKKVTTKKK